MSRAKPVTNPPNPSPGFVPCKDCGGLHYGSFKCPYLKPCVVCGADTIMACADCSIDSAGEVRPHVCTKSECRDEHERGHGSLQAAATEHNGLSRADGDKGSEGQ